MNNMLTVSAAGFVLCLSLSCAIISNRTEDTVDFILTQSSPNKEHFSSKNKCTTRLHTSLEKLRKREAHLKSAAFIDLTGYALHQTLRHLPLDMYVTDIRVKTPGVGDWVRIQKCQFSNKDNRMTAQIVFNDLTVSGTVQLLDDNEILKNSFHPTPLEFCKMSLRLQRAGLGINAFPTRGKSRGIEVKTEAKFMDPNFLSVHAYGCKLNDIFKRTENQDEEILDAYSRVSSAESYSIYSLNNTNEYNTRITPEYRFSRGMPEMLSSREHTSSNDEVPEVRIVTLNTETKIDEDYYRYGSSREQGTHLNDFHRDRILSKRLHAATEIDRLKAVLHIKNLIAQQVNHVFQTQGPFSQNQKPTFKPYKSTYPKPGNSPAIISTITELDENLSPIRPVGQKPFEALFVPGYQALNRPNHPDFQNYFDEVSREMEDIFFRGIKTLLTRYVEKQLEIPLKEALMVNFGYTVSYG